MFTSKSMSKNAYFMTYCIVENMANYILEGPILEA